MYYFFESWNDCVSKFADTLKERTEQSNSRLKLAVRELLSEGKKRDSNYETFKN
jgi:hypothetical protein